MLEINGTILAVIINFLILVWILKAFLYKPVEDVLRERKKQIEDNLAEAEIKAKQADSLKAEYEDKLRSAKAEAQNIVKKASEVADKITAETIEAAKIDAAHMRKTAEKDAEKIKANALAAARSNIADLVAQAAGKLIRKVIDPAAHKQLIDESIESIGRESLN